MPIDLQIRKIIEAKGHIKIDDMMRQVLSVGSNSYYRKQKNIGAAGDFITAPEISQLFGEVIALWVIEKWQQLGKPKEFLLIELGPGQGMLMRDLLRVAKLMPEFLQATKIRLVEINPHFIEKQKNNLSEYSQSIEWSDTVNNIPNLPTIVIANEFFDALPIKQYMKVKNSWYEVVLVTDPVDGRIKNDKIKVNKLLQKQLKLDHPNAKDGAIIEESVESLDMIRMLSSHFRKNNGHALIIDYGYDLQMPMRKNTQYNSSLQAIKDHQYQSIIDTLGEADLSAHVDFQALKRATLEQDIKNSKICTQKEFLIKYGIMIRLEMLKKNLKEKEAKILERQVARLIAEEQMGDLFKVLEFSYSKCKLIVNSTYNVG